MENAGQRPCKALSLGARLCQPPALSSTQPSPGADDENDGKVYKYIYIYLYLPT